MNSEAESSSSAVVSLSSVAHPRQPARPTSAHPAAELFPMMSNTDLGPLVEDIDKHGLREPILVHQGLVLDGRNRLRACEIAGVEPRFIEWDGVGSPLAIVLSRNLHRRHLSEGQRAIVAARAKGMFEDEAAERERAHQFKRAGDRDAENQSAVDPPSPQPSPEGRGSGGRATATANLHEPGRTASGQAAELLNVSERSVFSASRVLKSADEQVVAAVEAGDVAVSDAAAITNLPKQEQRQALEAKRDGRARTLRQAAEEMSADQPITAPKIEAHAGAVSRKRLRAEGKRFARDLDKLLRRLDAFTAVCGGPNDHTHHMRNCLTTLLRTLHECLHHFLQTRN